VGERVVETFTLPGQGTFAKPNMEKHG